MFDFPNLTRLSPKTIKLKAEARLDLLRQVGVAVDTWLKSAMNQVCFVVLNVGENVHMVFVFVRVCVSVCPFSLTFFHPGKCQAVLSFYFVSAFIHTV